MNWNELLGLIAHHRIGDLASIVGVAISIVGFVVTIANVVRSKTAAEQAEAAARDIRQRIATFNTVVDFSGAIAILEEVRRLHRRKEWLLLPDRYSAIRKILIALRSNAYHLSDEHQAAVQAALVNLRDIENQIEKAIEDSAAGPKSAKINFVISRDIDSLLTVLNEIKDQSGG